MKYLFLPCLISLLLLGACSQQEDFLAESRAPELDSFAQIEESPQLNAIKKYIAKKYPQNTRSIDSTILPYIVGGDTVMYIANYEDGWEVFSNDFRMPMILMKSETGTFYPSSLNIDSPFESFFQDTALRLEELKKDEESSNDVINEDWLLFGKSSLEYNQDNSSTTDDNDEYGWVWASSTVGTYENVTYTPKGGRLTTEWDQQKNFNLYTPYYLNNNSKHSPAGCVAIALGQFLYHHNKYYGKPTLCPTSAIYNIANNKYIFSDFRNNVWNKINSGPDFTNTESSMQTTAAFVGWIGAEIGMDYGKLDGMSSFAPLAGETLNFFNKQTGLNATCENYSLTNCIDILSRGYPVVLGLQGNIENHAVILDCYHIDSYCYDVFYVYVKLYGDETDEEEHPDFPDDATYEELVSIFGGGNVRREHQHHTYLYVSINWGWGAGKNQVKLTPYILWDMKEKGQFSPIQMYYF